MCYGSRVQTCAPTHNTYVYNTMFPAHITWQINFGLNRYTNAPYDIKFDPRVAQTYGYMVCLWNHGSGLRPRPAPFST